MGRLDNQFSFIREVDGLKEITRQSYLKDGSRKENDTEHSWHLALMAVILREYASTDIDLLRVITMTLIHDIVELDAGDTYAYDSARNATKREREVAAADRIFNILPTDQALYLRSLWNEFEECATPEAAFAHTLDNIQPMMLNDASGGRAWKEHNVKLSWILNRNKNTAYGSKELWEYARENFIKPNLEKGLIIKDTDIKNTDIYNKNDKNINDARTAGSIDSISHAGGPQEGITRPVADTKGLSLMEGKVPKIMTPGPVQVAENVRMARSLETTNPDLDERFYGFYKETCDLFAEELHTKNNVYILGGEGILGLEAACASLTEPGDRVLVIDNGIFGKGFADFVAMYGGKPVLYTCCYHRPVDVDALKEFLEKDSSFKYATIVHSDTPSGVLNPVGKICPLLKSYGILTVVDSVTGMFADELYVDDAQIDIVCGGSQKALSAPPGLSIVAVSSDALKVMETRKTPVRSFYANLLAFKNYYKDKWFPYTMPISCIYGLRTALDNLIADSSHLSRHKKIAYAVRKAVTEAGLSLYLEDGYASSVTVINVPDGITDRQILDKMRDGYGIMIAGCFDVLAGKVIRIGHMGSNANKEDVADTLDALGKALGWAGFKCKADMREVFLNTLEV